MALVSCPECAGQVSDQAVSCPHCGYPMQGQVAEPRNEQIQAPPPPTFEAPPPPPDDEPVSSSQRDDEPRTSPPPDEPTLGDVVQITVDNVKQSWNPKLNTDSVPKHYLALGCSGFGLLLILFLLVTLIAAGFDKGGVYVILFILLGWLTVVFFQTLVDLMKLKKRSDKSDR